jgi:CRISPR-associated protein Csd2
MGRKHIVPYALYRQEGFISANLAKKVTGFSEVDLDLLWTAIVNMFEFDRSAARGKMTLRKLIIFKHENELGNAPSHQLFEAVKVSRIDQSKPARAYSDYSIAIDSDAVPEGVTVTEKP